MTSFIVVAKNKYKREEYIKKFCDQKGIDVFDRTNLTLETSVKQNTQSIGIEDIKQMQKKIFLKPIKSEFKAIIVDDAQLLTIEAQNALLKVLEEPPAHTLIILSTDTKETILPTIISRCQVVQLEEEGIKLSEKEITEFEIFLEALSEWGTGERLKKAETLAKDKDKAIIWIEKFILFLREKMLADVILVSDKGAHPESAQTIRDSGQARMTHYIKSFQSLYTLLKTTNVNPRFAIENNLLNL